MMQRRKKKRISGFDLVLAMILILLCMFWIYRMLRVVALSFSSPEMITL